MNDTEKINEWWDQSRGYAFHAPEGVTITQVGNGVTSTNLDPPFVVPETGDYIWNGTTFELVDPQRAVVPASALPEPAAPENALATLRAGLAAMDERRVALAEAGDKIGLAEGIADTRVIIGDLTDLERAARADLADLMPREGRALPRLEVPGLGTVEVRGGMERKNWESKRLLFRLLQRALVDDDGVVIMDIDAAEPLLERIYKILCDCLPLTGSLQWRSGSADGQTPGLRNYRIEPDDFCEPTEKPRLATVPKRKETH